MTKPIIGEFYECVDTLKMTSSKRKFLGEGRFVGRHDYKHDEERYFLFESEVEGAVRYTVAKPVFDGVIWKGYFQNVFSGNSLETIFPHYDRPKFKLDQ